METITPIVTTSRSSFFEAAEQSGDALIVLREANPPSIDELKAYCSKLGGICNFEPSADVRTVKYDPTVVNSTAMSLDALPLHTDGSFLKHPPRRFLLSFLSKDADGGGVSTFMPISKILTSAPEWVLQACLNASFRFVKTYDGNLDDSFVGPILEREGGQMRIRWRSDSIWRPKVVAAQGTRAAAAVDWMHDFLSISEPFKYAADTGETLLMSNTSMLHGRTRLSSNSTRVVLRVWLS
ncbi:MAG: hypothetical protein C5B50_05620 [Verrucomicrobia bacterium]|nr:MAG: hypothetical protein C5B50_05620 [Verrucomicrobiota bacterium]